MNYEEKYKNALGWMQSLYDGLHGKTKEEAERYFPELVESEDERIRKAIIGYIDHGQHYGVSNKDMIAWLEKQGEQKDFAPKVEPKFHKGDWIIFNGLILHIDEIVDGYYRTTSIGGIPNSYDWAIDNAARLWTIKDAKDGDVLSYRDGQWIFIYKGIVTEDTFKYYALLSEKGITVNDAAFSLLTSCIIPATKEQRDLLFQKMKEAGYAFDFEKKELKKIEHKLAWGEDDEKMVNDIIAAIDTFGYFSSITTYIYYSGMVNWLKSLKDRVQPKQ